MNPHNAPFFIFAVLATFSIKKYCRHTATSDKEKEK